MSRPFPCPGHVCCCCFCCDVTSFSCFSKGSSWLPSEFPRPEPGTSTDAKEELPSESFLILLLLLFFCLPYSRLQLPFLFPFFCLLFLHLLLQLLLILILTSLLLFLLLFSSSTPSTDFSSSLPLSTAFFLLLLCRLLLLYFPLFLLIHPFLIDTLWFSVIPESKRNISYKLLHFSFIFISYQEKVTHYERAASPVCLTGNLCQNPVR